MLWLPLMAGAGLLGGMMKHGHDQAVENSDRNLAAATARYSPWTGMTPQPVRHAGSMFGDALQGATSFGMMGQGLDSMAGGKPAMPGVLPDAQNNVMDGASHMQGSAGYGDMSQYGSNPWVNMRKPTLFSSPA